MNLEEITMGEVRIAKLKLEQDLLERIKQFTETTGLKVVLVDVSLSIEPEEIYQGITVEASLV